jgi:hypothetical protein
LKAMDMNEAVRRVVIAEVERALAPHQDALERLEAFLGLRAVPGDSGRSKNTAKSMGQRTTKKKDRARRGSDPSDRSKTGASPGVTWIGESGDRCRLSAPMDPGFSGAFPPGRS